MSFLGIIAQQSPSTNEPAKGVKRFYYLCVIRGVLIVNQVKRALWKVFVSKEGK